MTQRIWSFTSLALVALPISAFAQAQGDSIFLYKGAPIRGSITAMTPDEISVTTTAGERKIPTNEIRYISYQDEPTELSGGRSALLQKNFNQALNDLKKLDPAKASRAVIGQDIEFYKAVAMVKAAISEGGDKAGAETAILSAVRVCGSNYHFYEAAEIAGDLAMSTGKFADASKRYGVVIAKATKNPEMIMRARLADGRALQGQKKFDEARARFDEVIADELISANSASMKLIAQVGKASCLIETGKPDDARKGLEQIIEKNDPNDTALFARTYVALGNAYVKLNKPKDAIMAFLAVELLFGSEPDALAESLYNLSKLWDQVNHADRALAARNTLKDRFPGSIWTQAN